MAHQFDSERLNEAWAEIAEKVDYQMNKALSRSTEPEGRLFKAMRYATLGGGKRLRPFLVMSSARLFGVSEASAVRVATAVEFVHSYSLVHDDLPSMDNSHLRRGKPATHIRYGEATALLAGCSLLTLAFEILTDENVHEDPRVRNELIQGLSHAIGGHGMIGGQMLDMLAMTESSLDIGAITRLQRMKTGELIAFSCESGAVLAKASKTARHSLRNFAYDLAMAFQIVDDLLDTKGDPNVTGKPTGQDEAANKATFVAVMGYERAEAQAQILADQAAYHLREFGVEADVLRDVAQFVVSRDH